MKHKHLCSIIFIYFIFKSGHLRTPWEKACRALMSKKNSGALRILLRTKLIRISDSDSGTYGLNKHAPFFAQVASLLCSADICSWCVYFLSTIHKANIKLTGLSGGNLYPHYLSELDQISVFNCSFHLWY